MDSESGSRLPENFPELTDELDLLEPPWEQGAAEAREADKPSDQRATTATQSIVIACPLEAVFAIGSALAERSRWQRGTIRSEHVEGPGARWVETRSALNGATELWNLEVVEFTQDESLTIVAWCEPVRVVEHHFFERDRSGVGCTRYTLSTETTGSHLTAGNVHKQMVDNLIHFRDCAETPNGATSDDAGPRIRRKTNTVG